MSGGNYSALIINDEIETADMIADVAESLGQSVVTVNDRQGFLDAYMPSVKCIVLELSMPDLDGIEVIRHLAETGCRASLVLTTDISQDLLGIARNLANALGFVVSDTLLKPFELVEQNNMLEFITFFCKKHSIMFSYWI